MITVRAAGADVVHDHLPVLRVGRLDDVLLAGVVAEIGNVVVAFGGQGRTNARVADPGQRVAVLVEAAAGLPAAVLVARAEPAGLGEEGLDAGGVDGDDTDELDSDVACECAAEKGRKFESMEMGCGGVRWRGVALRGEQGRERKD